MLSCLGKIISGGISMSIVEELKNELDSKKYPDDKIKFIFAKMNKESIPKDPNKIHQAFYELIQDDERYRELLDEFIFDTSGISPYSELLDRILYRLEISRYLGTDNPDYNKYNIKQNTDIQKYNQKFTSEEISVLEDISQELKSLLD